VPDGDYDAVAPQDSVGAAEVLASFAAAGLFRKGACGWPVEEDKLAAIARRRNATVIEQSSISRRPGCHAAAYGVERVKDAMHLLLWSCSLMG